MNNKINFDYIFLFESSLTASEKKVLSDSEFGLPPKRKYPLTDKNHVIKAIQYFKFCPEGDRKELASNILKAAEKFEEKVKSELILKYV